MAYFIQSFLSDRHKNWALFNAISPYTSMWNGHFFGTMQRNTTKFGVVVVANSSCLHLDLDLCSSFSFDVVSVSLCRMHNMYMHGKGRRACKCVGKCFDGVSP